MIYKHEENKVVTTEIELLHCPFCGSENIKPILLLRIETLFIEMFQWFNGLQTFKGMNTEHETNN